MTRKNFYIYEHWRPDTGVCFYVGRGTGKRASKMNERNQHHVRIVAKLTARGMRVDVRIHANGLSIEEALTEERVRIAFWRAQGIVLANLTAGGDGMLEPSDEVRAKMSLAHKTRWTPEARARHRAKAKAVWSNPAFRERYSVAIGGRKLSPEHVAKIAASLKGKRRSEAMKERMRGENNPFFGKRHPEETLQRIAAKKRGSKHSPETRAKMREAQQRRRATMPTSEETRARHRAAWAIRRSGVSMEAA